MSACCSNCKRSDPNKRCSGCCRVYYCNVTCQTNHWPKHKRQCKKWRKQKTIKKDLSETKTNVTDKDIADAEKLKKEANDLCMNNNSNNNSKLYQAKTKYLKALMSNPNDSCIYNKLSEITFQLNCYNQALKFGYAALEIDPSNYEYWINYGLAWHKLKNNKFAAVSFKTANELLQVNDAANKEEIVIPEMKEEDDYVNAFDKLFFNQAKLNESIINKAIDSDPTLLAIVKMYGVCNELVNAAGKKPECMELYTGLELFTLRKESMYNNDEYIKSLPQVNRVWNLVVYPSRYHKDAGKLKDDEGVKQEVVDTRTIDHRFEYSITTSKVFMNIKISNVSNGGIAWVNHGKLDIDNRTEWTELNDHTCYGKPTGLQIINVIKKVIISHRVAIEGDVKSERPKDIVIHQTLENEFSFIKKSLSKYKIGCYLQKQVPAVMACGPWDGYVIAC